MCVSLISPLTLSPAHVLPTSPAQAQFFFFVALGDRTHERDFNVLNRGSVTLCSGVLCSKLLQISFAWKGPYVEEEPLHVFVN